jgi:chorismate dehydratase
MFARPLRVGAVPYLVGRPLDDGLADEPGVELVHAVPSALVDGLRDGRLDVALVSSIELFRRPGLRWIPRLCVAGRAHVSSVQLFLRRPLADVRRVALDPASRTSAALVESLASDVGLSARFEEPPAGVDARAAEADAWLRIGDRALRESFERPALATLNPSAAWRAVTGLPFVFAVWIVAPHAPIDARLAAFVRARARGARNAAAAAEAHARANDLPIAGVRHYLLEECVFELDEELPAALREFQRRAALVGLADGGLSPRPVDWPA